MQINNNAVPLRNDFNSNKHMINRIEEKSRFVEKYGYVVSRSKDSEHQNEAKEFLKRPLITITRQIYRSQDFLDCMAYICNSMQEELVKLLASDRLIKTSPIAKLFLSGELEEHYILVHGAFVQHKKSSMPAWKRAVVYNVYLKGVEHYRRLRNTEARLNYRIRQINRTNGKENKRK